MKFLLVFILLFVSIGIPLGNSSYDGEMKKQKIVTKHLLNQSETTKKYIIAIDKLVKNASDKKLKSVGIKLENFSYEGKSENIKKIFQYLEAKISEEIFNRGEVETGNTQKEVVQDFGNSLKLEQTDANTYLTNKGNIIYTWKHESVTNPFIWDEACEPVWKIYEKEGNKDKLGVWDSLTENERTLCLKEYHEKNISVSNIISDDFIMFYEQGYESGKTYLLDMETNHVIDLNRSTEVTQVKKNKYGTFVLHGSSLYGTGEVIFNNGKENIVLFENNSDIGDINDSEYRQIKSFVIKDNKIEIEYIGQYGNSKIKTINSEM